jgi:hypothetical protein
MLRTAHVACMGDKKYLQSFGWNTNKICDDQIMEDEDSSLRYVARMGK